MHRFIGVLYLYLLPSNLGTIEFYKLSLVKTSLCLPRGAIRFDE